MTELPADHPMFQIRRIPAMGCAEGKCPRVPTTVIYNFQHAPDGPYCREHGIARFTRYVDTYERGRKEP